MPCLVCRTPDALRVSRVGDYCVHSTVIQILTMPFVVIYPCTGDAHESEIIPHDLTLLRKSPDVIVIIALKKEPPDLDVIMIIHLLSLPHTNQHDAMDFGYNQPIIKNTVLLVRNIFYITQ